MLVVDSRWIIAAALLSLRLGAVWALTPLTTMFRAPAAFRITFTLALSTPLAAALPVGAWPSPTNLGSLALGLLFGGVVPRLVTIPIADTLAAFPFLR